MCYPATRSAYSCGQRVISGNVVHHTCTGARRSCESTRAGIADSRRDKYNGGTRTDGSNPVGLENLSSVCRYYSRHPLLGRRIKRGPPPPSASGFVSSSIWRSHVSHLCFRFCELRELRASASRERRERSSGEHCGLQICSGTFDKSSRAVVLVEN